MSNYCTCSREPPYLHVMHRPVPFSLPPAFVDQLGYGRAVAALSSVSIGAPMGNTTIAGSACRAVVGAFREPARLERRRAPRSRPARTAGVVGQVARRRLVGIVGAWLLEHEVCLDGDDSAPALCENGIGHRLTVDTASNRAWVAVRGLARKIFRVQHLAPGLDD